MGKRVQGVRLLLVGESTAIALFVERLRQEYVDVDLRGKKCRERQSRVLMTKSAKDGPREGRFREQLCDSQDEIMSLANEFYNS